MVAVAVPATTEASVRTAGMAVISVAAAVWLLARTRTRTELQATADLVVAGAEQIRPTNPAQVASVVETAVLRSTVATVEADLVEPFLFVREDHSWFAMAICLQATLWLSGREVRAQALEVLAQQQELRST